MLLQDLDYPVSPSSGVSRAWHRLARFIRRPSGSCWLREQEGTLARTGGVDFLEGGIPHVGSPSTTTSPPSAATTRPDSMAASYGITEPDLLWH